MDDEDISALEKIQETFFFFSPVDNTSLISKPLCLNSIQ